MNSSPPPVFPAWYTLGYALRFMLTRKRLLGWSLMLFLATIGITTACFTFSTDYIDGFAGFLTSPPDQSTMWGMAKHKAWLAGKYLFLIISRIIAFYLAFLVAYCLTAPGYVFLSIAAEKIHQGKDFIPDENINVKYVLIDLLEGIKIGLFGVVITVVSLIANFIPLFGQAAVFLLYTYYSALMFIDFPASRQHWSLGRKLNWVRSYPSESFRLGLLPALISMIPLLNIFLLSLLFPLLTIYSTLNFCAIEKANRR